MIKTADLCDNHADVLRLVDPLPKYYDYGKVKIFCGPIKTLKVYEDNTLVRTCLEEKGEGRVLVIDGGGSTRCALVGDNIAKLAEDNGWAGIIVYGCIRDSVDIAQLNVGVKALGTSPVKSIKRNSGLTDLTLKFGGVDFIPGEYLYADEDGMLVSKEKLY